MKRVALFLVLASLVLGSSRAGSQELPPVCGGFLDTKHTRLTAVFGSYAWKHYDRVLDAAFLPEGRGVSASADHTLKVWDLETGSEIRTLRGHAVEVLCVVATGDGRTLLSGSADKTAKLWDLATGQVTKTLEHKEAVRAVSISEDGSRAATVTHDALTVWSVPTGKILRVVPRNRWQAVALAPGAGRALLEREPGSLELLDLETGNRLAALKGSGDPVLAATFSRDLARALVLTGPHKVGKSDDGPCPTKLRLFDLVHGTLIRTLDHDGRASALSLSKDLTWALVADEYGCEVALFDLTSGKKLRECAERSFSSTTVLAPDDTRALTACNDGSLRLWDTATGRKVGSISGHLGRVSSLAVSPDGQRVLTGGVDGRVKVWDATTARELRGFDHETDVRSLAFTKDGGRAWSAGGTSFRLWNLASGAEVSSFSTGDSYRHTIAFSPDRKSALAEYGAKLDRWDLGPGERVFRLESPDSLICALGLSRDGKRALTGDADGRLELWDLERRETIRTLVGHRTMLDVAVISSDGEHALTGSRGEPALKYWDLETGEEVGPLAPAPRDVLAGAISPDGRLAISASSDGEIALWDLRSLERIDAIHLGSSDDCAWVVEFMPDGRSFLAATGRGVVLRFALCDVP